jgi:hypothetical protein
MAKYLQKGCPRCDGHLGIVLRESGRTAPVQAINGHCLTCGYRLPGYSSEGERQSAKLVYSAFITLRPRSGSAGKRWLGFVLPITRHRMDKKQKYDPFVAVEICAYYAGTSIACMSPRLARVILADPAVTAPAFSELFGSYIFLFWCHRLSSEVGGNLLAKNKKQRFRNNGADNQCRE